MPYTLIEFEGRSFKTITHEPRTLIPDHCNAIDLDPWSLVRGLWADLWAKILNFFLTPYINIPTPHKKTATLGWCLPV